MQVCLAESFILYTFVPHGHKAVHIRESAYMCQILPFNSLLFSFQSQLSQDSGEATALVGHGCWWN